MIWTKLEWDESLSQIFTAGSSLEQTFVGSLQEWTNWARWQLKVCSVSVDSKTLGRPYAFSMINSRTMIPQQNMYHELEEKGSTVEIGEAKKSHCYHFLGSAAWNLPWRGHYVKTFFLGGGVALPSSDPAYDRTTPGLTYKVSDISLKKASFLL